VFFDYFKTWLIFSGIGILFGIIPFYVLFVDLVSRSVTVEKRKVPSWIISTAFSDPDQPKWNMGTYTEGSAHRALWIFSTVLIIACLAGYHYLAASDFKKGDVAEIVVLETSFPVFLILTWMMPIYFAKQYLRKFPKDNESQR
jgi:hypothetical protein